MANGTAIPLSSRTASDVNVSAASGHASGRTTTSPTTYYMYSYTSCIVLGIVTILIS